MAERNALIALYDATDGDNWTDNTGWKDGELEADGFALSGTEGAWFGITLHEEATGVQRIDLPENNLAGTLPADLQNLSTLETLNLRGNNLAGSIPAAIGNLSSLKSLYLNDNELEGSIPPEIGNLSGLLTLYLSNNQLTGSIPPQLGNLLLLIYLYLNGNGLTGSIPAEIGNLSILVHLCLHENQLTGPIPPRIGNLSILKFLYLNRNQLTGTIPADLGNLSNLVALYLSNNQLTGSIPTQLGNLSLLTHLYLNRNQLTGTIPTQLGNLSNLLHLSLSENELTGTIPTALGNLSNLSHLYLNSNQLTGNIPVGLSNPLNLTHLNLSSNQLTGNIPAQIGNLSNLTLLYLNRNQLTGQIPSQLGNLSLLQALYLSTNQLTGSIPSELGSLLNLTHFYLNGNQLSGSIPTALTNLTGLTNTSIGYNALYTNDDALRQFLNEKSPEWEGSQTIAPEDVSAVPLSGASVELSWTPISFIADPGGYRVLYGETSSGPYTLFDTTGDKSVSQIQVTGLDLDTTYYFVVQTRTNPHLLNQNTVDSEFSDEASAKTLPGADLSLSKSDEPDPVTPGHDLTYTVTIQNTGPADAVNLTLTDDVPAELENPQYSTDGGTQWQSWTGAWSLAGLDAGSSQEVMIRGTVALSATGTITNTAAVVSETTDPDTQNNSDSVMTGVHTEADLLITKTDSFDPVTAGHVLTYAVTVENQGPFSALNVMLTDNTPVSFQSPEYSTDGGTQWQPWTGSTLFAELHAGSSREVLIRGTVSSSATGQITNTAAVSSDTTDPDTGNNSALEETAVQTRADLILTKVESADPVTAGNELTYTLTVENEGPSDALNVNLTDTAPPELENPEYSTDGGTQWQPWTGVWPLGGLSAGSSQEVLIRGTVSSSAAGTISNTAAVSSDTTDPDTENNSASAQTAVQTRADLIVTKLDGPDPVTVGHDLTYTITVENEGPSDALNVTLTDTAPPGLDNPEYSTDGGTQWQPWTGARSLGGLSAGSSTKVLIRGTVSPSATGTVSNTASVNSDTTDPGTGNNSALAETAVLPEADLFVTKVESADPVIAGHVLNYTITVENTGPSDAADLTLTDTVPPELENPEYSTDSGESWMAWTGTWSFAALGSDSSRQVLIRGTVSPSATGAMSNTAGVTSDTADPDTQNNSALAETTVQTQANLSVTKLEGADPVTAGHQLAYTITVENQGPSDALNVTLTDPATPELESPEYSTDGGESWIDWSGSSSMGTLVAGTSLQILIRGTVSTSATGTISNTAGVSSDTTDPDTQNNSALAETTIQTQADLTLSKVESTNPVTVGHQLTYTITVNNTGPSDAVNVTLTDAVPPELENPEYSTAGGASWEPWTGAWTLEALSSGSSQTILIRGIVSPSAVGTISNSAGVSSDTTDPDTQNNSASVETTVQTEADLFVAKVASADPVTAGCQLTYTITVQNTGPSDAVNVTLTDAVPPELENPEYSTAGGTSWEPWTGLWSLEALSSGSSGQVLIRGTVVSSATGTITNTASVASDTTDPDTQNNSTAAETRVQTEADLFVTKVESADPVTAGRELTYTITVQNTGPSDALNLTLTDHVPSQLASPEYSTDEGMSWHDWTGSWSVETLSADGSQQVLIRGLVSPSATGTMTNAASVISDTTDLDTGNNSAVAETAVGTQADLVLTKADSADPVTSGHELSYTITVQNAGPSDALNVTLTDTVPPELENPEYSADGGENWMAWTGSWYIDVVSSETFREVLIRGLVSPSATGTITNAAGVGSDTTDPDDSNNSASVETTVVNWGDVNGDREVDLLDVILALKVLAGMTPSEPIHIAADLNGDGRIGAEDVACILQVISNLRQ